jgi:hypothetical protein
MYKRRIGLIMAVILILSVFTACGSSNKTAAVAQDAKSSVSYSVKAEDDVSVTGYHGAAEEPKSAEEAEMADSIAGNGSAAATSNVTNAILDERKIIRSANLAINVDNFDDAYNNINSIILGIGFIQESNINSDRYYDDESQSYKTVKNGTVVLRVSKDKFDSVINSLKGIGEVYNESINGQDVTDQYVDTESRIRLLKLEQSKLEAYLSKIDELDEIFKIESRLTEIRQDIERLTGNLNKLSSLVELSTITLTINEKYPGYEIKPKNITYGQRLLNHLKSSLEDVVIFLGDLLVFIVGAIPVLIVLGLFVLLFIYIYRKIPKRQRSKYDKGTAVKNDSRDNSEQDK